MNRLRDLIFRARVALGLDRGGIRWDWADDDPPTSAELWAELEHFEGAA